MHSLSTREPYNCTTLAIGSRVNQSGSLDGLAKCKSTVTRKLLVAPLSQGREQHFGRSSLSAVTAHSVHRTNGRHTYIKTYNKQARDGSYSTAPHGMTDR
jgi:hypothetical protein